MEDMKWITRIALAIVLGGLLTFLFYEHEGFAQPFKAITSVVVYPVTAVSVLCRVAGIACNMYDSVWMVWLVNILTGSAFVALWEFVASRRSKTSGS